MNITVKAGNTEFTLYGVDFVPQQGDTIVKDEKVYRVDKRVWDDDNNETIIYARLNYASVPADTNNLEVIELGKSVRNYKRLNFIKKYIRSVLKKLKTG